MPGALGCTAGIVAFRRTKIRPTKPRAFQGSCMPFNIPIAQTKRAEIPHPRWGGVRIRPLFRTPGELYTVNGTMCISHRNYLFFVRFARSLSLSKSPLAICAKSASLSTQSAMYVLFCVATLVCSPDRFATVRILARKSSPDSPLTINIAKAGGGAADHN